MSRPIPLRSIQILRALAATLVVVGHSIHDSSFVAERTGRTAIDLPYFDWGFGVDIFFVISGFIMIYTTSELFGQPGAASTFFKRRLVRIAPVYWLLTTGFIVIALVAPRFLNVPIEGWRSIVTSYLFIPDVRGNGEVRPLLAAGWTLNYEMFFYAIFAGCLLLPLRRGVLWLSGLFVFLSLLGWEFKLPGIALPYWSDSIILEFVLGIMIGFACLSKRNLPGSVALILAAFAILAAVGLGPFWGWNEVLPRFLYAGLPAAALVASAALGPSLPATSAVMALVAVGDASYSLYLVHPFVIRPLRNFWILLKGGSLPLSLYVAVCVVVAIAGALVIYRLVEKPLTSGLQRRMRGTKKVNNQIVAIPNAVAAPLSSR
jgi:exopolysaccharide production protein ExoZ